MYGNECLEFGAQPCFILMSPLKILLMHIALAIKAKSIIYSFAVLHIYNEMFYGRLCQSVCLSVLGPPSTFMHVLVLIIILQKLASLHHIAYPTKEVDIIIYLHL